MKDEFLLADSKLEVYQEWVLLVKQNSSLIPVRLEKLINFTLFNSSYWRTMLAR